MAKEAIKCESTKLSFLVRVKVGPFGTGVVLECAHFVIKGLDLIYPPYKNTKESASSSPDGAPKETWMRAPAGTVAVRSGEDALLTCVVLGARGKPVLWRRARDSQLLTAGAVRVTRDERVKILHDDSDEPLQGPGITKGGDVWALVIKSAKPTDSGLYVCELNTEPPVRSFHRLAVISRGLTPPESQNTTDSYSANNPTLSTLALSHNYTDCCIKLLPSPPEDVEVEPLSEKQLNITWSPPVENSDTVTEYIVNVTTLRSFDAHLIEPAESSMKNSSGAKMAPVTYRVPVNKTFLVLNDLLPFTMYEITVTSFNIHGSSLPSYSLRSLTLTPGKMKSTAVAKAPKLPDVRGCCISSGIDHYGCIDKLCDPTKTYEIGVTDLMICAPWAGVTFGCLANGMDHTPCCRSRGLPESCLPLCSGNITSLDFNHFKCLRFMSGYTNCLLQGYGVLPGPPTRLHLTNIDTDYTVVHWAAPVTLPDTVQYYNLHYKPLANEDDYRAIDKVQSPYILEDLESNTDYEIYVEAVNEHGVGNPSPRLIFRTQSQAIEEEVEVSNAYNVTSCCERVQVASVCMPLCSYDAKMSDLRTLAPLCAQEFHKLLRCGAGGTDLLPGPPRELHAVVNHDKLFLDWSAPQDGANATSYIVHWQRVDNNSQPFYYNTLLLDNMNVSSSCIDACSFHLDMDNIMDRPECMDDFEKLMKCAADGSDHRGCCASWGVPRNCLELCRGGPVSKTCALQHARRALACFRDSGAKLPGPPRNLKAHLGCSDEEPSNSIPLPRILAGVWREGSREARHQ
ncbi:unnamed protein product [Leptidea sinapis]|uniref:Ig-like and fibronectin type-III domain-containing protein C25G4.10 n=1 Tax=Leptidea sinapis TaxID=189913 RepID=A0A5E4QT85_9NEOP|nr:unnamed protein product [Leptidea sinapis]